MLKYEVIVRIPQEKIEALLEAIQFPNMSDKEPIARALREQGEFVKLTVGRLE